TLTRVKKPEVGHNDVMIRIRKTAICGTDLHIWNWDEWAQKTIPVPMHVGHEYVGEIVEIGQEVRGFEVGDRVSGEGHITCGFCRNCRAGRRHLCRIMAAAIARHVGARYVVITDVNDYRLGLARRMGATRAVNVERENLRGVMTDLRMTEGFDVGLEMSGVPQAFADMLEHMNHGGKI